MWPEGGRRPEARGHLALSIRIGRRIVVHRLCSRAKPAEPKMISITRQKLPAHRILELLGAKCWLRYEHAQRSDCATREIYRACTLDLDSAQLQRPTLARSLTERSSTRAGGGQEG